MEIDFEKSKQDAVVKRREKDGTVVKSGQVDTDIVDSDTYINQKDIQIFNVYVPRPNIRYEHL